jgi:hypothetical protein
MHESTYGRWGNGEEYQRQKIRKKTGGKHPYNVNVSHISNVLLSENLPHSRAVFNPLLVAPTSHQSYENPTCVLRTMWFSLVQHEKAQCLLLISIVFMIRLVITSVSNYSICFWVKQCQTSWLLRLYQGILPSPLASFGRILCCM